MALQHLRTSTAHKRPIPSVMSAGQLAINTNEASPGLFFKDSNGDLVKVGPVHIGTDAPNSSPASVAATALVTGTVYQILTVGTSDFTLVGASANTVGTIFTATGTTTGDGTVSGQQGVEKGEQWLDTTGGTYVLKIYDGTAWRSESGTFVDVNGDTMTGSLILPSGTAAAPALGVGSTDNGLYSPGTDQVAVSTNGTGRLFIDSSGNVGIGTSAPQQFLHVHGTNGRIQITSTGTGSASGDGALFGYDGTNDLFINNRESTNFKVFTAGTQALAIDSSQRVGIGTTSPTQALDVVTSTGNAYIRAARNSQSTGQVALALAGGTSGTDWILYQPVSSNDFRIFGNSGDRLTITSTGNVGIGISPNRKLQVEGASGGNGQILISTAGAFSGTDTADLSFRVYANPSNGNAHNPQAQVQAVGTGNYSAALTFKTAAGGSDNNAPTERMRIDSSGNLGVGDSSPANTLSVLGASTTGGSSTGNVAEFAGPNNTNGFQVFVNDTNNNSGIQTKNGDALLLNPHGGRIGIGTTGPDSLLHLSASSPRLTFTDTDTGVDHRINCDSSVGSFIFDADFNSENSNSKLLFKVRQSDRMVINSSGNVGIGTSSPARKLHVVDSNNILRLESTSTTASRIEFENTGSSSGDSVSLGSVNNDMQFVTSGSEKMRINSNGNVGIGTDSPSVKLEVKGTGFVASQISGNSTNETQLRFATNTAARVSNQANTSLIFDTNATERMRITSGGNVGIGTSSPNNLLDVQGTSNPQLKVSATNTGTNSAGLYIENQGQRNWQIWADRASDQLRIGHNNRATTVVSVTDTRVGIGTSSPAQLLDLASTAPNIRLTDTVDGHSEIDGNAASLKFNADKGNAKADSTITFAVDNSEKVRITSGGNVGIGTSSPIAQLTSLGINSGGEGGTMCIQNTGSGVNTNVALYLTPNNGGGNDLLRTAAIKSRQDIAGNYANLEFYTSQSAAPAERMRISSSGLVGIGMIPAGTVRLAVASSTSYIFIGRDSGGTTDKIQIESDGDVRNTNNSYGAISDQKLKENIVDASSQWEDLKSLQVRNYNLKEETGHDTHRQIGLVAQEVEQICPGLVTEAPDLDEDGEDLGTTTKSVNYSVLYMKAVKALQEAMERIETLEQRLNDAGL